MLRIISFPASMAVLADATISEIVALKIEQAHAVNLVHKEARLALFFRNLVTMIKKAGHCVVQSPVMKQQELNY